MVESTATGRRTAIYDRCRATDGERSRRGRERERRKCRDCTLSWCCSGRGCRCRRLARRVPFLPTDRTRPGRPHDRTTARPRDCCAGKLELGRSQRWRRLDEMEDGGGVERRFFEDRCVSRPRIGGGWPTGSRGGGGGGVEGSAVSVVRPGTTNHLLLLCPCPRLVDTPLERSNRVESIDASASGLRLGDGEAVDGLRRIVAPSSCRPVVWREMAVAEGTARRTPESFKAGERSTRQGAVRQKN